MQNCLSLSSILQVFYVFLVCCFLGWEASMMQPMLLSILNKKNNVTKLDVHLYEELSVDKIRMLIKDVNDFMLYFPKYKTNKFLDRKHMFNILSTHGYEKW